MEAFSLLKYWKGGGPLPPPSAAAPDTTSTAILAAEVETDGDDGPFFDLEFTVPDEEEEEAEEPDDSHVNENPKANLSEDEDEDEDDEDDEFKLTLSPSSNDRSDPNLSLSPSDDLFFKGKVVQLEPVLNSSEPNSKAASLLKSASKFRVFRLGLKKSKSNGSDSATPNPKQQQRKLFTVKFKVEEVPIVSLFSRDNSSRGGTSVSANKASHNQNTEESQSPSEEKRFSKEVMQKYLKKVKPLYVKVSRRYAEKLRFSGQLNIASPGSGKSASPPAKAVAEKAQTEAEVKGQNQNQKQGNLPLPLPAGLRDVCKHLGKSRSASSTAPLVSSRRRDDSLLQQQDGIQGAILHCKRSFNASRECESSQLPRSVSDPLHEISPELSRKSTNESKDKRL